ncbi:putative flavin-containing monooxygenase 1 [Bidens hawaiensis]|uniref:putative flavin-containing monooxygenase 1 n=1 Tax=Bidens hawaiensis TaxID=980011 RepID=UPI0040493C17
MGKKQIAIIGAGVAGLSACKHCLSKGFNPIVFELESQVGGVWTKTIRTTRLQTIKDTYQFSDFPWPPSVTGDFPTQQQVLDYIHSYATHFDLIHHINFNSRVKGISYDGPSSDTWSMWNGTGDPFPPQGKWNLTVEHTETKTKTTKVYTVDFVILCVGRFKDVPNIPQFSAGEGPEVFCGQAIHSMEYSAMDNQKAAEFVKGKKIVVVGFGKTGIDIARECASVNGPEHPCTIVYRHDHWKLGSWFPWGISLQALIYSRFQQLLFHKPGEGFFLSLVATLLSPLRWAVLRLLETYIKSSLQLAKFDMVPQHSFSIDLHSGYLIYLPNPENFIDTLEKGSIKLKKSSHFSFYENGVLIPEDNTHVRADIVICATGFNSKKKIKDIFESPTFSHLIENSQRIGLYRECIPPRIPQLAIIGYSDGLSSVFVSESASRWVAALLEGKFKLPTINEMEKDVEKWDALIKRVSGEYYYNSSFCGLEIWYNDQICKDIGMNPMRKKGLFSNIFQSYGPSDYAEN